MGVRAYNSSTGRFDQPDPITGGSANAYDYVFQNPVTSYDLSGMCRGWGHASWGPYLINIYFNGCAAGDLFTVLGGLSGFTAWLFVAVLPLDWPVAVAIATAIAAISGLLAAWAYSCDLFGYVGPRVTITFTDHAWRRYSYMGYFYATIGCWG